MKATNENCLVDMHCPECESEGPFGISVSSWAIVSDDGIENTLDSEWDADSPCACRSCGFNALIGNFTFTPTP